MVASVVYYPEPLTAVANCYNQLNEGGAIFIRADSLKELMRWEMKQGSTYYYTKKSPWDEFLLELQARGDTVLKDHGRYLIIKNSKTPIAVKKPIETGAVNDKGFAISVYAETLLLENNSRH